MNCPPGSWSYCIYNARHPDSINISAVTVTNSDGGGMMSGPDLMAVVSTTKQPSDLYQQIG